MVLKHKKPQIQVYRKTVYLKQIDFQMHHIILSIPSHLKNITLIYISSVSWSFSISTIRKTFNKRVIISSTCTTCSTKLNGDKYDCKELEFTERFEKANPPWTDRELVDTILWEWLSGITTSSKMGSIISAGSVSESSKPLEPELSVNKQISCKLYQNYKILLMEE